MAQQIKKIDWGKWIPNILAALITAIFLLGFRYSDAQTSANVNKINSIETRLDANEKQLNETQQCTIEMKTDIRWIRQSLTEINEKLK